MTHKTSYVWLPPLGVRYPRQPNLCSFPLISTYTWAVRPKAEQARAMHFAPDLELVSTTLHVFLRLIPPTFPSGWAGGPTKLVNIYNCQVYTFIQIHSYDPIFPKLYQNLPWTFLPTTIDISIPYLHHVHSELPQTFRNAPIFQLPTTPNHISQPNNVRS